MKRKPTGGAHAPVARKARGSTGPNPVVVRALRDVMSAAIDLMDVVDTRDYETGSLLALRESRVAGRLRAAIEKAGGV